MCFVTLVSVSSSLKLCLTVLRHCLMSYVLLSQDCYLIKKLILPSQEIKCQKKKRKIRILFSIIPTYLLLFCFPGTEISVMSLERVKERKIHLTCIG